MYFKRDLQQGLQAVSAAGETMARVGAENEFLAGYASAIKQMALFFGVRPEEVLPPEVIRLLRSA